MGTRQEDGDTDSDEHGQDSEPSEDVERMEKSDSDDGDNEVDAHFTTPTVKMLHTCRQCSSEFESNNKLHTHICDGTCKPNHQNNADTYTGYALEGEPEVVRSTAKECPGNGLEFRNWHYATTKARFTRGKTAYSDVCIDTGCGITLIDRKFLKSKLPNLKIRKMKKDLWVRGIGSNRYSTMEYVVMDFYIPGTKEGKAKEAWFTREAHIVDDLKANVLIALDATVPEGFTIDLPNSTCTIKYCDNIVIPIRIKAKAGERISKTIKAAGRTVIPAKSMGIIPVYQVDIPSGRDYVFEPGATPVTLYAHLVDSGLTQVLATNYTNTAVTIPRAQRLGRVHDMEHDGCFFLHNSDYALAERPPAHKIVPDTESENGTRLHIPSPSRSTIPTRPTIHEGVSSYSQLRNDSSVTSPLDVSSPGSHQVTRSTSSVYSDRMKDSTSAYPISTIAQRDTPRHFKDGTTSTTRATVSPSENKPQKTKVHSGLGKKHTSDSTTSSKSPNATTDTLESLHPTGVTIYGNQDTCEKLGRVVEQHRILWEDRGGFADVPVEDWLRVPRKTNWEDLSKGKAKVYPLGIRDREVIDKEFDKLQSQGRVEWTSRHTPFSYPVFVVWKNTGTTRKGRAVVDIRGLNAITQKDAYPVPLQTEVIAMVHDSKFISTIDATSFFYQWRVHPNDRHKLTVVTHRGQETFKVAVMGFCNSPAYVQRQIDRILRPCRNFARAYVDDIVIYSRTLNEHLHHLHLVFCELEKANISIKAAKSYLGYPSISRSKSRLLRSHYSCRQTKCDQSTKIPPDTQGPRNLPWNDRIPPVLHSVLRTNGRSSAKAKDRPA